MKKGVCALTVAVLCGAATIGGAVTMGLIVSAAEELVGDHSSAVESDAAAAAKAQAEKQAAEAAAASATVGPDPAAAADAQAEKQAAENAAPD